MEWKRRTGRDEEGATRLKRRHLFRRDIKSSRHAGIAHRDSCYYLSLHGIANIRRNGDCNGIHDADPYPYTSNLCSSLNTQTVVGAGLSRHKYFLGAVGLCFLLCGLAVLPGVRSIFSIPASFGLSEWLIATGFAFASVVMMEGIKLLQNKR